MIKASVIIVATSCLLMTGSAMAQTAQSGAAPMSGTAPAMNSADPSMKPAMSNGTTGMTKMVPNNAMGSANGNGLSESGTMKDSNNKGGAATVQ